MTLDVLDGMMMGMLAATVWGFWLQHRARIRFDPVWHFAMVAVGLVVATALGFMYAVIVNAFPEWLDWRTMTFFAMAGNLLAIIGTFRGWNI